MKILNVKNDRGCEGIARRATARKIEKMGNGTLRGESRMNGIIVNGRE
jgi:hypothetical protein